MNRGKEKCLPLDVPQPRPTRLGELKRGFAERGPRWIEDPVWKLHARGKEHLAGVQHLVPVCVGGSSTKWLDVSRGVCQTCGSRTPSELAFCPSRFDLWGVASLPLTDSWSEDKRIKFHLAQVHSQITLVYCRDTRVSFDVHKCFLMEICCELCVAKHSRCWSKPLRSWLPDVKKGENVKGYRESSHL